LKNGAAGASCTTDRSDYGIVIKCGDQETTILDGKSCTVKETANKAGKKGLQMDCEDGTSGTVWDGENGTNGENGTSCTATTVTDEKTGKSGIQMYCGYQLVGTVWNGDDGVAGANCVSTDNKDGTVDIKCGDADPVTIYKALCGDASYDPDKKFCVLGKLYDKCGGKAFSINTETCIEGNVVPLCLEYKKLKNGTYQFVSKRGIEDGEFCWNGIVTPKCGGKEFGQHEFCGKAFDGKTDSIFTYCDAAYGNATGRGSGRTVNGAYYALGIPLSDRPTKDGVVSDDVPDETGLFGGLIGSELELYDIEDLQTFYERLGRAQNQCEGIENAKWCGDEMYDETKQFCDIRDNHVYVYTKFDAIEGIWWMNENLAFEYKLPKVVKTPTDDPDVFEKSIDQVMGNVNYEDKVFENFEAAEGRYYTWKSAMGVGDFRQSMTEAELNALSEKDSAASACPAGWRLPTQEELEQLRLLGVDVNNEDGFIDVGFDFNFVGYYDVVNNKVVKSNNAFFWSQSEDIDDNKLAYGIVITAKDEAEINTSNKVYAFTIRCVTETDPAGAQ
jgi:uncharacterized protein (TIGR02145 family)